MPDYHNMNSNCPDKSDKALQSDWDLIWNKNEWMMTVQCIVSLSQSRKLHVLNFCSIKYLPPKYLPPFSGRQVVAVQQYGVRFVNLERTSNADVVDERQFTLVILGEPDEMNDVRHHVPG